MPPCRRSAVVPTLRCRCTTVSISLAQSAAPPCRCPCHRAAAPHRRADARITVHSVHSHPCRMSHPAATPLASMPPCRCTTVPVHSSTVPVPASPCPASTFTVPEHLHAAPRSPAYHRADALPCRHTTTASAIVTAVTRGTSLHPVPVHRRVRPAPRGPSDSTALRRFTIVCCTATPPHHRADAKARAGVRSSRCTVLTRPQRAFVPPCRSPTVPMYHLSGARSSRCTVMTRPHRAAAPP
jgi:hypothetical protein